MQPAQLLPALDPAGAVLLTELVLASLRRRVLIAGSVTAGTVILSDGRQLGLHNLSAELAGLRQRDWPGVVERHCAQLLGTERPTQPDEADPSNWYLKLRLATDLPYPIDYAEQPLPGVLALAAVDTPLAIEELLSTAEQPWLTDLAAFRTRALDNLARLPAPELITVQADPVLPDSRIRLFHSDDYFGASRLLILDQLLAEHLDSEPADCLIAVPHRQLLVVHPIVDIPSALAAIGLIGPLATEQCGQQPGPISPEIYYRSADGEAEQLSRQLDGRFELDTSGRFGRLLAGLPEPD